MALRDVDWAMGELSPEHRGAVALATEGVSVEEATEPAQMFRSRPRRDWKGVMIG